MSAFLTTLIKDEDGKLATVFFTLFVEDDAVRFALRFG